MDDLKLLGRIEDDFENEINIVKATGKDINMTFGVESMQEYVYKEGESQSKTYEESTFKKNIKELDPRKSCKYSGIEDSHDIKHKREKAMT